MKSRRRRDPAPATTHNKPDRKAGLGCLKGEGMPRYIVYVIESQEGYRYTGYTDDLDRRLEEHNQGSLSFWTKRGTEWKVVYQEECVTASEAMKREKWLKSGIGREFLKQRLGR